MHLKHLSLTNFRNFARLDLDVPRRAVLLVGSNAQGKTSVLEAVYFLAAFTSFQTHADRQIVNFKQFAQDQLNSEVRIWLANTGLHVSSVQVNEGELVVRLSR